MIFTLNGWQRLWVVASCLYLIVIAAYAVIEFREVETNVTYPELQKKLSSEARAVLVPEDDEGWMNIEDIGTEVEMPNGSALSFKHGVSEQQMNVVAKEYWGVLADTVKDRRLSLIGYAVLWWLVPCVVLYILGWAIGWVYRGFRGK